MFKTGNLISYLPQFVQEYREIKEIMKSEEPEMLILNNKIDRLKNNQFILTCDEVGIGKFEELLDIRPLFDDKLDTRISRVITRWNDSIPYTYRGLIEKLNILCGEGNYILFPNFDNYELTVQLALKIPVEEVEYLLEYMIPANIKMIILVDYNKWKHVLNTYWNNVYNYTWKNIKESEEIRNGR